MCIFCEGDETQVGIPPALAARARRIEAAMPGERVPEEAWRIMLGEIGGNIAWPHTQRMLASLDEAAKIVSARLRCDPA